MTEKEQRILEMQAPSTRKCLERSPDLDLTWLRREIPKSAQVTKADGSVDLNIRNIIASELAIESGIRSNRGAMFEAARAQYLASAKIHDKLKDQIETPHVIPDADKRERAIEAFMKSRTIDAIKNAFHELMKDVKRISVWAHVSKPSESANDK